MVKQKCSAPWFEVSIPAASGPIWASGRPGLQNRRPLLRAHGGYRAFDWSTWTRHGQDK
jgi:hypothetical protein